MTTNIGFIDRFMRFVLAAVLIVISLIPVDGYFWATPIMIAGIAFGIILSATAWIRFCPLYKIFGIRTCNI